MKKYIIASLFLFSMITIPVITKAEITPQMIQSAKQSPESKAKLIQLIIQMISVLQEQLKVAIAQEAALAQQNATLNQIAQNTQQIVQNTTPVSSVGSPTPMVLPIVPVPLSLSPIQDYRWFSVSGKDSVGCSFIDNVPGKFSCKVSLKNGAWAMLTMDNGNKYFMDDNKNISITELEYNPTWVYAGSYVHRTATLYLFYQDPVNGLIKGERQLDFGNINNLKDPN